MLFYAGGAPAVHRSAGGAPAQRIFCRRGAGSTLLRWRGASATHFLSAGRRQYITPLAGAPNWDYG
ncbi:MAG: hypothetical protein IKO65_00935 [Victivallales bacterium]|nr:hypothetical protein [Victivallales bacterium]